MKKNNYEIQCEKAKERFVEFDYEKIAKKFDLEYDDDYLYVFFVGRKYRLGRKNGAVQRIEENLTYEDAQFNEVISILDLLDYSKDVPKDELKLSGKFVTPHGLKGTISGGNTSKHSELFYPYAKKFSKDIEGLKYACEKLNGRRIETGDVGYIIDLFENIPVMIVFYDEDCDFDAEIKIFWDENILDYVHYETTFYMVNHLFDEICKIMDDKNKKNC